MPRIKRLYRVEATEQDGTVMFRRDYQGYAAAVARAERLLDGADEPGNGPYDDGYYREPAAKVTIQESEPVQFTAEPTPHRRAET